MTGDLCQYAGNIENLEPQIERSRGQSRLGGNELCERFGRSSKSGSDVAACDIHEIGDYSRRCWCFTGATSLKEEVSGLAGVSHHRVEGSIDVGQRLARAHHGRLHTLVDPLRRAARDAEEFD